MTKKAVIHVLSTTKKPKKHQRSKRSKAERKPQYSSSIITKDHLSALQPSNGTLNTYSKTELVISNVGKNLQQNITKSKSVDVPVSTIPTIHEYNNKINQINRQNSLKIPSTQTIPSVNEGSSEYSFNAFSSTRSLEQNTNDLNENPNLSKSAHEIKKREKRRERFYYKAWTCCRCSLIRLFLIPLLCILIGGFIAAMCIGLIRAPSRIVSTSTSTTSSSASSTSTTVTSVTCITPYSLTPSQTCVNTMIDFNNCGSVGHVCPSTYLSCSAGVCSTAPALHLANPNPIWSSATNGSADDRTMNMAIPFPITLYGTTTNTIVLSTNGVLCLGSCSIAFTNNPLPNSNFGGVTVLPYWDDLYVYPGTSQGIYYGNEGNSPNRTLIFEYYMSHYNLPNEYYQFQAIFFESQPGVVQFQYFYASDGGVRCTIGVQKSAAGPSMQYSYNQAGSVQHNMTLTFNTNLGTYTSSTSG